LKILSVINKNIISLKAPSDINEFENILVVSNSGLGDTLLSTPAIISLRKSFPEKKITFLVNKKMFPLFKDFEFVDSIVLYSSGFFQQLRIIFILRRLKIDTVFLFHSNGPEDIFFSILSGARNILKATNNTNHEFKDIFLNKLNGSDAHNIEKKLDLVKIFNPRKISKRMLLPSNFYQAKSSNTHPNEELLIGFQMGAQDIYKMWPTDNFIEVFRSIESRYKNLKIVLLGSSNYEKKLANYFLENVKDKKIINMCGKTQIQDLPLIIKSLDLLLTNDTGTLHLAIALKIKTISLFGPTNSKEFGPYQDLNIHHVIQEEGSFVNRLPKKQRNQDGMELIKVDTVIKSINKLIPKKCLNL